MQLYEVPLICAGVDSDWTYVGISSIITSHPSFRGFLIHSTECGMSNKDANACRKPTDSVNFVIAHDGFTLYDLVSYNEKHNDQNGEGNRSVSSMGTLYHNVQMLSQQCLCHLPLVSGKCFEPQRSIRNIWWSLPVGPARITVLLALHGTIAVLAFCRDGSNDNFSWNCGVEGETDDEKVNALRQSQMRNMHMALMLSQGTPMLLMGELLCLCSLPCISSPCEPSAHTQSQLIHLPWQCGR